jgi:superfamily I DNA/RNA helicase
MVDKGVDKKKLMGVVLKNAIILWEGRIDLNSIVLSTHDTYLKLWQLSKPQLPYKVIYLDECQDSTMCVFDIIKIQKTAKIILVGDARQMIYSWRGSVNVMDKIEGSVQCKLTKSFRFGQKIADIANNILQNTTTIVGYEKVNSIAIYCIMSDKCIFTRKCGN